MKRLCLALAALILLACAIPALFGASGRSLTPALSPTLATDVYRCRQDTQDDAGAIQAAIDAAARPNAPAATVYIPPGIWRITRTLHVPQVSGLTLRGAGQVPDNRPGVTAHFGGSMLVWDGPAGGTMIQGSGSTYLTLSDLSLTGRPRPDAPNRAGLLLHAAPLPGWGTGAWTVRNVNCIDADVGIQCGSAPGDLSCSDNLYERVGLIGCGTGFRTCNDQSLNHLFIALSSDGCSKILDIDRGGNVTVLGGSFANGGEVRFGPGGDNAAVSTFEAVRWEGGIRIVVGPYRRVEFRGLHEAAPVKSVSIDVTGSTLMLTGPTVLWSRPAVRLRGDGAGSVAAMIVRDAMLAGGAAAVDAEVGCSFRAVDCFSGWGR
jgi:hypothetical protein